MLTRQVRAYKKTDKPPKHQKALPPEVFRELKRRAVGDRAKARADLAEGALFFCMRSCEMSKTPNDEQRTRPIRACDVYFRKEGLIIPHNSPRLDEATHVTIVFGIQKCDEIDEPVTQHRTSDSDLCPVRAWTRIVRRLRRIPKYNPSWPVFTYHNGTSISYIKSSEIRLDIRVTVDIMGEAILGFTSNDVGTHSIRAGGAMMMYLGKQPIPTIMMIGRWHSNAFLTYIEKQVLQFSQGVSQAMLTYNTFQNIPVRPWTSTDPDAHSFSANHYLSQLLHQTL